MRRRLTAADAACAGCAPPFYLQVQIYARSGLDLDRSTLPGWLSRASFHLKPAANRLAEHLKRSSKLFMDETRVPVLDPGSGKTRTGWLSAPARDDCACGERDSPAVTAGMPVTTGR